MKFNEIYIVAERLQFEEMLMKENLKEMYDYLGYEKFNNYVQNSELNEDFKHKVKNFGKVAALNAALLAGSLGLASCTPPTGNNIIPEDTPIENPVEDDEEDTEEEEAPVEEEVKLLDIQPLEGEYRDTDKDMNGVHDSEGTLYNGLKFKFNKEPVEVRAIGSWVYDNGEIFKFTSNEEVSSKMVNGYCVITITDIAKSLLNGGIPEGWNVDIISPNEDSSCVETSLIIKFLFKNGDSYSYNYTANIDKYKFNTYGLGEE